jgi:hypothetical protein
MGSKLLGAFLNAGLPRPTMIAASRAESGPDSKVYAILAQIVQSILPLLERTGATTAEEADTGTLADRLRQDAVANESVTFWPRLVGAWSRLPKSGLGCTITEDTCPCRKLKLEHIDGVARPRSAPSKRRLRWRRRHRMVWIWA